MLNPTSTPLALLIYDKTTTHLGNWLACARNHVHGRVPNRSGTGSGLNVWPLGWHTVHLGQDGWKEVSCWHGSWSQCFPGHRIKNPYQTGRPPTCTHVASNDSTIKTYKLRTIPLCFAIKNYKLDFIIVEVSCHLLGVNFLRSNLFFVDLKGNA